MAADNKAGNGRRKAGNKARKARRQRSQDRLPAKRLLHTLRRNGLEAATRYAERYPEHGLLGKLRAILKQDEMRAAEAAKQ